MKIQGRTGLFVILAIPFVVLGFLVLRVLRGDATSLYAWTTVGFFTALSVYLIVHLLRLARRTAVVAATDDGLVEDGRLVAPWLAVTRVRWLRDWVEIHTSSDARPLRAGLRDPEEQEQAMELARKRAPAGAVWRGEGGGEFPLHADRRATIENALVVAAIFLVPVGIILWPVVAGVGSGRIRAGQVGVMAAALVGMVLLVLVPLLHRYITQLRVSFSVQGVMRGPELAVPWQQMTKVVVRPGSVVIGTAVRRTAILIDLECWPEPGRLLAALRRYAPPGVHVKPGLM